MATTSITLRIPNEILAQIPERRGDRSRALIELLRKGLSLPTEKDLLETLGMKIEDLEKTVEKLSSERELNKKAQDKILQRLTKLESSAPSVSIQSGNGMASKSKDPETIPLPIPPMQGSQIPVQKPEALVEKNTDDIPEKSQLMSTGELLNILKREAPHKNWTSSSLIKYRSKKNSGEWHNVGKCRLKFSGQRAEGTRTRDRQWKFWVLYPFKKED